MPKKPESAEPDAAKLAALLRAVSGAKPAAPAVPAAKPSVADPRYFIGPDGGPVPDIHAPPAVPGGLDMYDDPERPVPAAPGGFSHRDARGLAEAALNCGYPLGIKEAAFFMWAQHARAFSLAQVSYLWRFCWLHRVEERYWKKQSELELDSNWENEKA